MSGYNDAVDALRYAYEAAALYNKLIMRQNMNKNADYKHITCKVCGFRFYPDLSRHYIACDASKFGFAAFSGGTEPEMYDAFDCPACGSQIIAQQHKRKMTLTKTITDKDRLEQMAPELIAEHLGITSESVELLRKTKTDKTALAVLNQAALENHAPTLRAV